MSALLGDAPSRDYARKLRQFNAFARPELCRSIGQLGLRPGMRVLDAGCGTGEVLEWLDAAVAPSGCVTGWDLSAAHVEAARARCAPRIEVRRCDLLTEPLAPGADFIWCGNTLNHFADREAAARRLASLLAPGGKLAIGQSSLLPDMVFAWDSRLERLVNEAVRRYYRDKYGLCERDLTAVRSIVGALRAAGLRDVAARSILIERISPLDPAAERYLEDTIFASTWGERLRPYLGAEDYAELARLCDRADPAFALRRPDFHFLQTYTLVTAHV
ncbi:MAG TPA: methyltransferase domain-containing protein [Steroidobacteraceae bacterium]|jgi:SAM-dependent methyltransferase|nr:methyltransferase domain-containing protein [Steroidobacteraceae bacterium]